MSLSKTDVSPLSTSLHSTKVVGDCLLRLERVLTDAASDFLLRVWTARASNGRRMGFILVDACPNNLMCLSQALSVAECGGLELASVIHCRTVLHGWVEPEAGVAYATRNKELMRVCNMEEFPDALWATRENLFGDAVDIKVHSLGDPRFSVRMHGFTEPYYHRGAVNIAHGESHFYGLLEDMDELAALSAPSDARAAKVKAMKDHITMQISIKLGRIASGAPRLDLREPAACAPVPVAILVLFLTRWDGGALPAPIFRGLLLAIIGLTPVGSDDSAFVVMAAFFIRRALEHVSTTAKETPTSASVRRQLTELLTRADSVAAEATAELTLARKG